MGPVDRRMSAAPPDCPPSARELAWVCACAVVVAACLLWPLPLHLSDALVTAPTGEGVDHVWRWWALTEAGQPWGATTSLANFPTGFALHGVDPFHALWARALGWPWGGPAGGLAVVQLLGLTVGAAGAWGLAAVDGAGRPGRWLAAAIGVSAPTLVGAAVDGITEGLGLGWVAVQLALLLATLHSPQKRWPALWALSLALTAWTGPYNAIFALLVDLPVLLRAPSFSRVVAGATGVVLSAPVLYAAVHLRHLQPGSGGRTAPDRPPLVADWRGAWRDGADILDVFLPVGLTGHAAAAPTTAYVGVVTLGLALVGVVTVWRSSRRTLWFGVGALVAVLVALGPFLTVAGEVVQVGTAELRPPAALLEWVPGLNRLSRWYRAGAVAVLLLAPLAARAITGRRAATVAAMCVLLDARWGAPVPFPVPWVPVPSNPTWSTLGGPVVDLPPIHPIGQAGFLADHNLLVQMVHQQPTSATDEGIEGGSPLPAGLRTLVHLTQTTPPDAPARAKSAIASLQDIGYTGILLYPDRLSQATIDLLVVAAGTTPQPLDNIVYLPFPAGSLSRPPPPPAEAP